MSVTNRKGNCSRAFTLIELLIVIAIIALLTGIIMSSFAGSRSKARDGKRISDLKQIQLVLELYFNRCGQYPVPNSTSNSIIIDDTGSSPTLPLTTHNGNCSGITLNSFISTLPKWPGYPGMNPAQQGNNYYDYRYAVNSLTNPTDYILHTTLESTNPVVYDGVTETAREQFGASSAFFCYNLTYTRDWCLGPRTQ